MPLSRPIAVPPIPSPRPGVVVIIRSVGPGFLLRLTD
jgi:hypothetical protein